MGDTNPTEERQDLPEGATGEEQPKDTPPEGEPDKGQTPQPENKTPPKDSSDDEPQVRQRKTPKDFIIERQQKKIAKMQSQQRQPEHNEEPDDEGDDDEVNPADEKLIAKVLGKHLPNVLKPILDKEVEAEDERELSGFLAKPENADFQPYADKVRKYMRHPSRQHLPVESLFYEVAGRDLIRIGAERERAANAKAKETQSGGGSAATTGGDKASVWDLPSDEFEKQKEAIKRQRKD